MGVMETKQGQMQAEERIDRAMTMKGWIAMNAIHQLLEAKDKIVAIAMIAGVVVEVAPNNTNKSRSIMTRMTSGTLTKGLTMSKTKLLNKRNLPIDLREEDMVTAKKKVIDQLMKSLKEEDEVETEEHVEVIEVVVAMIEVAEEDTMITSEMTTVVSHM